MIIKTSVMGQPCQAELMYHEPAEPRTFDDPGSPEFFEWRMLNMRGAPWPWIEDMMTRQDDDAVDQAFRDAMAKAKYDADGDQ